MDAWRRVLDHAPADAEALACLAAHDRQAGRLSAIVDRQLDAARAVAIPMDREVIHVLPQEYIVDDQTGIQNPVGMAGVRLEAKIHIVTGAVASAHNLVKCANRSGLDVSDIVLESLASGEAVLTDEEKQLGTALLDLGGGTTDLAIFSGKNIKHTFVLALGGNNLTNDIAVGLRAPQAEAEKIKKKYGTCLAQDIGNDETIEVPSVGDREPRRLARQTLVEAQTRGERQIVVHLPSTSTD